MPRQAAEPRLDRVDRLDHAGEIPALDDLLDQAQLLVGGSGIVVPDRDGRGDVGLSNLSEPNSWSAASASIALLWASVSRSAEASLVITSLRIAAIDFALGEPLPPDPGQEFRRIGLVEHDRAGRPAVGEGEPVEVVENAGRGRRRKPDDGQDAQMRVAQHRLEAAGQWLIGEHRVEMHRDFGHSDALPLGRDRRVQVGQRLLRRRARRISGMKPSTSCSTRLVRSTKPRRTSRASASIGAVAAFVEQPLGSRGVFGRWQIEEASGNSSTSKWTPSSSNSALRSASTSADAASGNGSAG